MVVDIKEATPADAEAIQEIMQDAFHSQFESLVKREFPKSNLDYIISMRGSTGCWFYRKPENFQSYAAAMKPDLLVIGGISNYQGKDKAADTAAILEGTRLRSAAADRCAEHRHARQGDRAAQVGAGGRQGGAENE